MMFFNHGFVVSAISTNKSLINSQEKQKLSIFTNWWWTWIIGALFGVAGLVCDIVMILLLNKQKEGKFFKKAWENIMGEGILLCIAIGLIYGLLPSGCHFFWRRSMLKNNHKHAKGWLIAFWVLVGFALAVVLGFWVMAFVNAKN